MDATLPRITVRSLRDAINLSLVPQRVAAGVTAGLGVFGLLLAALGVYGVLAHAVVRRTKEIGIRMALGGNAARVTGVIVRSGMRLVGVGLALGVAVSLALAPLTRSLLVGVDPVDPTTVAWVMVSIVVTALLACAFPAWRATRVEPSLTLRQE